MYMIYSFRISSYHTQQIERGSLKKIAYNRIENGITIEVNNVFVGIVENRPDRFNFG